MQVRWKTRSYRIIRGSSYSRVGFDSSVEVKLSLYYGGVVVRREFGKIGIRHPLIKLTEKNP